MLGVEVKEREKGRKEGGRERERERERKKKKKKERKKKERKKKKEKERKKEKEKKGTWKQQMQEGPSDLPFSSSKQEMQLPCESCPLYQGGKKHPYHQRQTRYQQNQC